MASGVNLTPSPVPGGYRWNARAARWIAPDGRFVPALAPRQALEGVISATEQEMLAWTRRLQAHEISLAAWQRGMLGYSKRVQLAATLAAGGSPGPTFTAVLTRHIEALDGFAAAIAAGQQPMDGRLLNRARQYAQSARATWELVREGAEAEAGRREYRNLLHRAEHCGECPAITARGWQPIGTLTPIGARPCRGHDRCSWEYR